MGAVNFHLPFWHATRGVPSDLRSIVVFYPDSTCQYGNVRYDDWDLLDCGHLDGVDLKRDEDGEPFLSKDH